MIKELDYLQVCLGAESFRLEANIIIGEVKQNKQYSSRTPVTTNRAAYKKQQISLINKKTRCIK